MTGPPQTRLAGPAGRRSCRTGPGARPRAARRRAVRRRLHRRVRRARPSLGGRSAALLVRVGGRRSPACSASSSSCSASASSGSIPFLQHETRVPPDARAPGCGARRCSASCSGSAGRRASARRSPRSSRSRLDGGSAGRGALLARRVLPRPRAAVPAGRALRATAAPGAAGLPAPAPPRGHADRRRRCSCSSGSPWSPGCGAPGRVAAGRPRSAATRSMPVRGP